MLMKKSLKILLVMLSLIVVILLIWGNQIFDGLKSIMTGISQTGNMENIISKALGQSGDESSHKVDSNPGQAGNRDETGNLGEAEAGRQLGTNDSGKNSGISTEADVGKYINEEGGTVRERILVPEGFERVDTQPDSFGEYLRKLPLKPNGFKVTYYNGNTKPLDVHVAVLDMDVGDRDLQQCADSIIRLRAEYLYGKGLYEKIHFNFTNGFNADYSKWMEGYRIKVSANKADWVKQGSKGNDYASFRKYLDMVFAYAGTLSLSKEMENIPLEEMQPGDIFLKGASPGHCVIVMDMADNRETGDTIFIAAQGYMPAQEMHILKNPANEGGNPWYRLDFGDELITPEWTFTNKQLYRFED